MFSFMDKFRKARRNKKGFTLIELIVVIAILGILALVAIPRFANVRINSQAQARQTAAMTVLNAAEIQWIESETTPTGGATGNLVTNGYLRNWPTDGTYTINVNSPDDGEYTVDYDLPTGYSGTLTGTVPQ